MKIYNKAKWILGILMIFILILATNLIDRNNFVRVKDSVVAIYEDRIVANDLIFEMSKAFQEKEIAAIKVDSTFFEQKNKSININIKELVKKFHQTKLTLEESKIFDNFEKNLNLLLESETLFIRSNFSNKKAYKDQIFKVKINLYNLSKIQLNEGKRQMSISQKAIDTVELFTQIEIYFLIFLAIVVQVVVMYSPKNE